MIPCFFSPFSQRKQISPHIALYCWSSMFTPPSGYYNHPLPVQLTNTTAVEPDCQRRKEETEQEKSVKERKEQNDPSFISLQQQLTYLKNDAEIFKISFS